MKNVLELLENTASRFPEKLAFGDENTDITFCELVNAAKSVGTLLAGKVSPCSPIPCYLEKSTATVCCMLGIVYAGCFYSTLDLGQPATRTQSILGVLQPQVIITDREHLEKLSDMSEAEILCVEDIIGGEIDEAVLSGVRMQSCDTDPLYVNFTSGSTGVPKGVTICHRSVIDFIGCFVDIFGINENDVLGNQAPFDFDVSVKDIYSGIASGAKVQLIPRSYFSAPAQLMDYLSEKNVTVLVWAVSAMCFVSIMNGFEYRTPTAVRKVMFSGEVLPIKHYNKWKKYLPNAEFVNLYGPTEITCNCTYYVVKPDEYDLKETFPIGIPFPNERVFLLDEEDKLVTETGISGEICVSGTALALGYYNDPERTAQAFVQNPLNSRFNEIVYRTGDLGKYDENGNLVYISRKDFQIKHLGHRIELGEIEAVATACVGITRACCIYDGEKKRLRLFYTGEREKSELIGELRTLLPHYMIPNTVVQLDEMPVTKNGKIDRRALAEYGGKRA